MIRLTRVSKRFDRPVLRDVTLHVPRGCLYGLIGPGASGKSVLLKLISGLLRPESGSVVVGGAELQSQTELELATTRKSIGMAFQNNALFDFMTVAENVAFPLRRLFAPPEDEVRERVLERLRAVALPGFESRLPAGLSGGQRKRVGIARATITRPPVLLFDEPAAGLDPVSSQRIFELLRDEQRATGATVIMVSSDIERLLSVTDRVGMMLRGQLVFDGTTEEARRARDPYVRQFVHGDPDGPL